MTEQDLSRLNNLTKSISEIEYIIRLLESEHVITLSREERMQSLVTINEELKAEFALVARRIETNLKRRFQEITINF